MTAMIDTMGVALAERGLVPLAGLRLGVQRVIERRLLELLEGHGRPSFERALEAGPLALSTETANEQHYEVPAEFFEIVLGPRLKYSSGYWPEGVDTLARAEDAMLGLTCERAGLEDGQDVLELGCGWGSLTLHMASAYPASRITAVSNSRAQRRFIEQRAPSNVRVITADVNDLVLADRFDRVVSVEMFEHMRNYAGLLRTIRRWMRPEGKLFVHIFCHREHAYPYEVEGRDDWMARYFFTGGTMPSFGLLGGFDEDLTIEDRWAVDGRHYSRTARAWRDNLESRRDEIVRLFRVTYGRDAARWYHRWRLFFLACEELFGYRDGNEWLVGHYRFAPSAGEKTDGDPPG
jgi:cyclopropane-fatty-acyl-phospholipid synthase